MKLIKKTDKIFIAGHKGLVGSEVLNVFREKKYKNIVTVNRKKIDLTNQKKVGNFFKKYKPKAVIICAAKVGGIKANNTFRGEFIYENLMIQNNIIHASYKNNVKSLIFLGSSCIYPKFAKQPIKEEYLLSGKLEQTNEPYAIAKIAGLKLCESYNKQYKTNFKCLMPCNLYGPNDNFDLQNSHFLPAIISKFHSAHRSNEKKIKLWGTGTPKRELMHVRDLALAIEKFINLRIDETLINIGSGYDKTIRYYAKTIQKLMFKDVKRIIFDNRKHMNGTQRKLLDVSLAKKYKWKTTVSLEDGLKSVINHFCKKNI